MRIEDIKDYEKARGLQRTLKENRPPIGIKEFDVLLQLYLAKEKFVPYSYLIKKTGQPASDLSSISLGPLEAKGYIERRINEDHSGEAKITSEGKRLIDKL